MAAGKNARNTDQPNDFQQVLKQSYKKATATYDSFDEFGRVRTRNFFGVKIINNTQGIDEITGSRMFQVHTRKVTKESKAQLDMLRSHVLSQREIIELRNQWHIWTCDNVDLIFKTYTEEMAAHVDRSDEISAPMWTIAKLAGHHLYIDQLTRAIATRDGGNVPEEDQALEDALAAIIEMGHRFVTAHLVINEMARILGNDWGQRTLSEIPEWRQPQLVSRRLVLMKGG